MLFKREMGRIKESLAFFFIDIRDIYIYIYKTLRYLIIIIVLHMPCLFLSLPCYQNDLEFMFLRAWGTKWVKISHSKQLKILIIDYGRANYPQDICISTKGLWEFGRGFIISVWLTDSEHLKTWFSLRLNLKKNQGL